MDRRSWTMLLWLAAIWGASYLFIKVGIRDFSPAMVVLIRVGLGALVLVPVALRRDLLSGIGRPAGAMLFFVALIQVSGPFLLINEGEQEITSALAGILVASAPIFTALLAIVWDQEERSHGLRLVGIGAGIVGVGVLLGFDLGGEGAQLLGALAVILASFGYAVGGLLVRRYLSDVAPLAVATLVLVFASVQILPLALVSAPTEAPGLGPIAAVTALGVLGTGVAFAIFYDLIATVGTSRAFIVTYLAPAFAVVYGALLLDEKIAIATVVGLGLILLGSYLAAEGRLPGSTRLGARPIP